MQLWKIFPLLFCLASCAKSPSSAEKERSVSQSTASPPAATRTPISTTTLATIDTAIAPVSSVDVGGVAVSSADTATKTLDLSLPTPSSPVVTTLSAADVQIITSCETQGQEQNKTLYSSTKNGTVSCVEDPTKLAIGDCFRYAPKTNWNFSLDTCYLETKLQLSDLAFLQARFSKPVGTPVCLADETASTLGATNICKKPWAAKENFQHMLDIPTLENDTNSILCADTPTKAELVYIAGTYDFTCSSSSNCRALLQTAKWTIREPKIRRIELTCADNSVKTITYDASTITSTESRLSLMGAILSINYTASNFNTASNQPIPFGYYSDSKNVACPAPAQLVGFTKTAVPNDWYFPIDCFKESWCATPGIATAASGRGTDDCRLYCNQNPIGSQKCTECWHKVTYTANIAYTGPSKDSFFTNSTDNKFYQYANMHWVQPYTHLCDEKYALPCDEFSERDPSGNGTCKISQTKIASVFYPKNQSNVIRITDAIGVDSEQNQSLLCSGLVTNMEVDPLLSSFRLNCSAGGVSGVAGFTKIAGDQTSTTRKSVTCSNWKGVKVNQNGNGILGLEFECDAGLQGYGADTSSATDELHCNSDEIPVGLDLGFSTQKVISSIRLLCGKWIFDPAIF